MKSAVLTHVTSIYSGFPGGVGQDHVRAIFAQAALLDVLVRKVVWCWSFSSKQVTEISLSTIILNFFAYHPPHGEARG